MMFDKMADRSVKWNALCAFSMGKREAYGNWGETLIVYDACKALFATHVGQKISILIGIIMTVIGESLIGR